MFDLCLDFVDHWLFLKIRYELASTLNIISQVMNYILGTILCRLRGMFLIQKSSSDMWLLTKVWILEVVSDHWMIGLRSIVYCLYWTPSNSKFSFWWSVLQLIWLWLLRKVLNFETHICWSARTIITKCRFRFNNIFPFARQTCFRYPFNNRWRPSGCIFWLTVNVSHG